MQEAISYFKKIILQIEIIWQRRHLSVTENNTSHCVKNAPWVKRHVRSEAKHSSVGGPVSKFVTNVSMLKHDSCCSNYVTELVGDSSLLIKLGYCSVLNSM